MEESLDIFKIFNISEPPTTKYYAEYDPVTGNILKVGPEHALSLCQHTIAIEEEIALSIIKGEIFLSNCGVDIIENKFILFEKRNVVKIDDLLHRIIDIKYSNDDRPYIFLTYNKKNNSIKVEMTELYLGTKKWPKKYKKVEPKKVHWDGDTKLNFLVTAYNDPTILYETFSLSINDLVENSVTVKLSSKIENEFSVFTRRIFKSYAMTTK